MNTNSENARADLAWNRLENWVQEWHRVNPGVGFIGTLGGASQSEIFYPDVSLELARQWLEATSVSVLNISSIDRKTGREIEALKTVDAFLDACCRNDATSDCYLFGAAEVRLAERTLEIHVMVERKSDQKVDCSVLWIPLLAFFNVEPFRLRDRFDAIFGYFFGLQARLGASRILFCKERATHPRTEANGWMEI